MPLSPSRGDPVPRLHPQVHPGKEGLVPKGLAHLLEGEQIVGPELGLGKLHLQPLSGLRPAGGLQALHPLFNGEGPLVQVLGVVLVHGADGVGEPLQLRLLLFVPAQLLQVAPLLFQGVEGVVTGVKRRLALLELHHPGDGLVQEVAVVGDDQDGALIVADVVL